MRLLSKRTLLSSRKRSQVLLNLITWQYSVLKQATKLENFLILFVGHCLRLLQNDIQLSLKGKISLGLCWWTKGSARK